MKVTNKIKRYFKKLIQFFFILLYGRVNKIIDAEQSDRVYIEKINKNYNYKVFVIQKGRIFTNRIDDTAVISDNKLINGPSYQLRSSTDDSASVRNSASIKENIVLKIGTPKFKKKIKGTVLSLLSGGGANKNYFHWLYDVLPRFGLLEELTKKFNPDYLLTPNYEFKFQLDTLEFLGFKKEKIFSSKFFKHLECDELIVTDHPYNITGNTYIDHEKIPPWISYWLKKKFLALKSKKKFSERIYIDRGDTDNNNLSSRKINNEIELKKNLKKNHFEFIKLQDKSFEDQLSIFNSAKIVVGLHGAGFANISFCKENTKIIELKSLQTMKVIENIAHNNKLDYCVIKCELENPAEGQSGAINVPVEEVIKII